MTRWLETDSLSNQDISGATAIGAYTADADRLVLVQWFADQVAGNGDYTVYLTHQVAGAGSAYRYIPVTEAAAASGLTAIAGQSIMVAVRNADVLTLYLDGLAGDTVTPDTTVRWFELAALRPATADRTINVDGSGYVRLQSSQGDITFGKVVMSSGGYGDVALSLLAANGSALKTQGIFDFQYAPDVGLASNVITVYTVADSGAEKISDAVWDEARADHDTEGTFGATDEWAGSVDTDAIADAVWDEATSGHSDAGSTGKALTDILEDTGTTLPASLAALAASSSLTVINAVSGDDVTVYAGDTWYFDITVSGVTDWADYDVIAFSAKATAGDSDNNAYLLLRSDDGLVRINQAAPTSADNGTLTKGDDGNFVGQVAMSETASVKAASLTWWLKAFDDDDDPDEGYTLATGDFTIKDYGVESVTP